jgi:hypothetical protein
MGGPDADSRKSTMGHVTLNMCFSSGMICGSRSVFGCVRGTKHQHIIFQAQVGLVHILEKA